MAQSVRELAQTASGRGMAVVQSTVVAYFESTLLPESLQHRVPPSHTISKFIQYSMSTGDQASPQMWQRLSATGRQGRTAASTGAIRSGRGGAVARPACDGRRCGRENGGAPAVFRACGWFTSHMDAPDQLQRRVGVGQGPKLFFFRRP